jgi:CRISPR-associated protein (TIGR03984 family)
MNRSIQSIQSNETKPVSVPVPLNNKEDELKNWLSQQAKEHNLRWLLAHADDGVIWGEMRDDNILHLSSEEHPTISPKLRWVTLQQCRLFGNDAELFFWQGPKGWHAQLQSDSTGQNHVDYIDEEHLLWGYETKHHTPFSKDGFLCIHEGSMGIVHTPPIQAHPTEKKRAKLRVRHYLKRDEETGIVRIDTSRLVELIQPKGTEQ